ncbi:MAG: SDR family NAD(P)-dependent oxidoreductase, partial [Caldilinea sp.]
MLKQVMMRSTVESRRFVDKVAVITGAAGGIGGACALRFAQEGANIACLDIAAIDNERIAAQCCDLGVDAVAIACDVTDVNAVNAAFAAIAERWTGVDIVVAAAGVYTGAPLEDVPDAAWLGTLATNLTGAFYTNRAAAPYLRQRGAGSIINISSMAGKTSWPGSAEYSASKSGLI